MTTEIPAAASLSHPQLTHNGFVGRTQTGSAQSKTKEYSVSRDTGIMTNVFTTTGMATSRLTREQPSSPSSSSTASTANCKPTTTLKNPSDRPLRIAILLNSYNSPNLPAICASYIRTIHSIAPSTVLHFYYPAYYSPSYPKGFNPSNSSSEQPAAHQPGKCSSTTCPFPEADSASSSRGLGSPASSVETGPSSTQGSSPLGSPQGPSLPPLPDPSQYDLIVLGGGNIDPRSNAPWVLRVHEYIRSLVKHWPKRKVLGICWGHQTLCRIFGAQLEDLKVPELGVTTTPLTPLGRTFFHTPPSHPGHLRIQQHHRRGVSTTPPGFSELLAGKQSFLSHSGTILTFQGHPEKDAQCAKMRLYDAVRWFGVDPNDREMLKKYEEAMELPHDGREIWVRVLEWVREKTPEIHL